MSRPNFFCNMNTLVYLAQMKYSDDHKDIDISVDCIDAPAWLLFSSDEENYYLKLIKRYEFFGMMKTRELRLTSLPLAKQRVIIQVWLTIKNILQSRSKLM